MVQKVQKSRSRRIIKSKPPEDFELFFPNLREMYCYGRWEEVCCLLSPSLRRVVILEEETYHPPSLSISTLVDALPKICPDIQSLEAYVDLPSSASRSIHKLQKLQYLGLDFLMPSSSTIEHIIGVSLLQNLRSSQFSMPPSDSIFVLHLIRSLMRSHLLYHPTSLRLL